MREVSCRPLEVHFRALEQRGIDPAEWTGDCPYPLAHLKDKQERIDWESYRSLLANLRRFFTEDELIAQGGSWIESPVMKHVALLMGTFFAPRHFYTWLATTVKNGKRSGGGSQVHACQTTTCHDLGKDHLRVDIILDEGYTDAPEFWLLTLGGFRVVPRIVGKPNANVTLTPIDRGMSFDVQLPTGSDRVSRLRRAYNWLTSSSHIANELDDANDTLRERYEEIERQRAKLARQAAQLSTAHAVNTLIQQNLDLDLTLATIATALVQEAGFARASLTLDCVADSVEIRREVERGEGGAVAFERILEGRGQVAGKLTVWAPASSDPTQREELLAFIVPSVAMAIDNAISYLVMDDYRRGLEIRVAERTQELREAKEARDRIFANINHDIRSPLSLILLAVAEARRNDGAEKGSSPNRASERTLGSIEHGARRVLRMVDELLILAEGRETDVKLATARCDLGRISEVVAEAWKSAAEAADLTLSHEVVTSTFVLADPNALERILANLVSNALKFTPRKGTIGVTVRVDGKRAILEVADNGKGIDDELKTRLFGRFERGESARKGAVGGSGLGLSLVKGLAEAHGGSVFVLDTPGGGATFRVELPLAESDHLPTAAESSPALRPDDYAARNSILAEPKIYECRATTTRATLLLAEDDPALREYTAELLSDIYRVIAAPDGLSALALAKDHAPDLLITDIAMPGMDGIELTKAFRALPNNRMAPVLILTTFGGVEDKLAGFDAGAIDHIHKPFEPDELRARVRSQLAIRSLALQLLETEKLAALGTLSAGLAHEIRNPANGIVNAVAPLRECLPPEAIEPGSMAAELLDVIEHCANQVGALSRELLGFKRGVELKRTGVPLDSLLRRIKTTMQHTLEHVQYREDLTYKGPIRCAEPLFAQVLTNLIENGAHAAGRGGWVEVRSGLEEQRVVLEITDSGPGVPEHLRERIFEPFFTTKPAGSGTGLGLSTARDIALRHGGTLDVRREARGGMTRCVFRLTMPLES